MHHEGKPVPAVMHSATDRLRQRGGALIAAVVLMVSPAALTLFPVGASGQQVRKAVPPGSGSFSPEQSIANGALRRSPLQKSGQADPKHGEQIALGRAACKPGGACGCLQCHQIRGQGSPIADFPRIGGQAYRYLYSSLRDFASGRRHSKTMQPIASSMSKKDMRDVAAYYAALQLRQHGAEKAAAAKSHPSPEELTQGGVLAAVGSAKDGVQGCQNCHGPAGAGLPPDFPFLGGQYAKYLEAQLQAFKSGERPGGSLHIMRDIAKRLSDKQIHAVAEYYASIRPARPIPQTDLAGPTRIGAPLGPQQGVPHGTSTNGKGQK